MAHENEQTLRDRLVDIAVMTCAGATQQEIADKWGVHRATISRLQDTPEVQEEIERIHADSRKAAKRYGGMLVGKAAKVWDEALSATTGCPECGAGVADHAIRLRAADSVADRFGMPKTEVQELMGGITLGDKSDHELERMTLEEAANVLDARGAHSIAQAIRELLAPVVGGEAHG